MMGYDDQLLETDNPFGDANLSQPFIWKKKYEKMGMKDIDPDKIERENKKKLEKNKQELEKVKQRRLEREREIEERRREQEREQREKEAREGHEWVSQEGNFHLKQAKLRSKLRMKDGRAKPIDLLARYIDVFGERDPSEKSDEQDDVSIEVVEPYQYLNNLRLTDLEDLQEDIKTLRKLDHKANIPYWNDLEVIVEDELHKLRSYQASHKESKIRSEDISSAVSEDINVLFKGKSPQELEEIGIGIEEKINSGQEGVDISYWESLASRLKSFLARARLRERHERNLKMRLEKLKEEQKLNIHERKPSQPEPSTSGVCKSESSDEDSRDIPTQDPIEACIAEYERGCYSPSLLSSNQLPPGTIVSDPDEDWRRLQYNRCRVLGTLPDMSNTSNMSEAEMAFEREARRGMNTDESVFSSEEIIKQDKSIATWSDKYKPRKPRYFNRVHTGFEWNKYNQTHYDVDNPPPKIVQGYKFNIFYPDLLDKAKAPTYSVTPCPENRDFAIIRFKAGPPYEDIAFKIVNREWNYSYKSGFRSQFQNNILQLWFHFKRLRYRR